MTKTTSKLSNTPKSRRCSRASPITSLWSCSVRSAKSTSTYKSSSLFQLSAKAFTTNSCSSSRGIWPPTWSRCCTQTSPNFNESFAQPSSAPNLKSLSASTKLANLIVNPLWRNMLRTSAIFSSLWRTQSLRTRSWAFSYKTYLSYSLAISAFQFRIWPK